MTTAVMRTLDNEGVPTPGGGRHWDTRVIKRFVMDDVYKPHTFDEVKELVAPEVAARLDPDKRHGIWWYNRRRVQTAQVSEMGANGKLYRKQTRHATKDRSEWIAVPVPDAGIPRELVEAARHAVRDNRTSISGEKFWELSGGVMYCGCCGRRMATHSTTYYRKRSGDRRRVYYYRCQQSIRHKDACLHRKHYPALKLEADVWEWVADLLTDPERLRVGLERMIDEEQRGLRGDPTGRRRRGWISSRKPTASAPAFRTWPQRALSPSTS
jgi:hypothetical protein